MGEVESLRVLNSIHSCRAARFTVVPVIVIIIIILFFSADHASVTSAHLRGVFSIGSFSSIVRQMKLSVPLGQMKGSGPPKLWV